MAITASPQASNTPPRVSLTVSGLAGTEASVYRNDPDGRTRPVRTAEPAPLTGGAWVGFDYEAPFGAAVSYSVVPTSGTTQTSATVTLNVAAVWLIHPGIPDLSVCLPPDRVERVQDRTRQARSAVMQPLGRVTPIVVAEARTSATAGLEVWTDTYAERDALLALLADGAPVLVNIPPSLGWGVASEWAAVNDVTEQALSGASPVRRLSLPYVVVDRPVGAIAAEWTWAGVIGAFGSWSQLLGAYDTWAEVLANTPNEV